MIVSDTLVPHEILERVRVKLWQPKNSIGRNYSNKGIKKEHMPNHAKNKGSRSYRFIKM